MTDCKQGTIKKSGNLVATGIFMGS